MALSRRSTALLSAGLLISGTTLAARERVVTAVPQSAAAFSAIGLPVNLDHLVIGPVQATLRLDNDIRTLLVESNIANTRGQAYSLPPLRVSVRDASGATLYTWTTTPPLKTVPPRGHVPVRARLTAPPQGGQDVVVEFAHPPV